MGHNLCSPPESPPVLGTAISPRNLDPLPLVAYPLDDREELTFVRSGGDKSSMLKKFCLKNSQSPVV